ncbi:MAG: hypothetical protein IKA46_07180 [Clostridia bacterium]|nr:hypothetical protein [Clostridia bacterium]
MRKALACLPCWYKYVLVAAYALPFTVIFNYTVIVLLGQGLWIFLTSFFGSLLVGSIVFFPFMCIYYAFVLFLHTIIWKTATRSKSKKKRVASILLSFVCSAFLASSSILTIQFFERAWGWVPFLIMLIAFFIIFKFFIIHSVSIFSFKQIKGHDG